MTPGTEPPRSPVLWLLWFCGVLLVCAICLNLAVALLRQVWPWLVGMGLLIAAVAVTVAVVRARRQRW